VQVTDQAVPANTFSVTPAGKLYFLSKRTGQINVMKSDLDGKAIRKWFWWQLAAEDNYDTHSIGITGLEIPSTQKPPRRHKQAASIYLIDTMQGDKTDDN